MRSTRAHDAVGLVADQPGQLAVRRRRRLLEKLRRAADAGERVLHLMRQHRRHAPSPSARRCGASAGGRSCAAIERSCSDHDDQSRSLRRAAPPGSSRHAQPSARRLERDAVFGDAVPAGAHLLEQREERAVGRHEIGERRAEQRRRAGVEELLGRGIGIADAGSPASTTRTGSGSAASTAPARSARRRRVRLVTAAAACMPSRRLPLEQRLVEGARSSPSRAAGSSIAVDRGAELGRAGQALRVPADMLARHAHAGVDAVMRQHRLVMLEHDVALLRAAADRRSALAGRAGSAITWPRNQGRP